MKISRKAAILITVLLGIFAVISVLALTVGFSRKTLYYALGIDHPRCYGADGGFSFFMVGNGDCSAVYTDDVIGLIDTGTERYAQSLRNQLETMTVDNELDFVVISHPHDDHGGGLSYILQHFKVKRMLIGLYNQEQLKDYACYQELLGLARERDVEILHPSDGEHFQIGGVGLTFYQPRFYTTDENERNLIVLATVADTRCLFMGDGGTLTESVLLSRGYNLTADILKIGHHGSRLGTTESFLQAVSPAHAVFCVGANSYGHPHDEVIKRLSDRRISFYRTDTHKRVTLLTQNRVITTRYD